MSKQSREHGVSQHHKGIAGEQKVAAVFHDWRWQTAKPQPDLGGDLLVSTSDPEGGAGPSFHAQIKAGIGHKSSVSLRHNSAATLRDHVLPAFAFYLNQSTRMVSWAYIEPLFQTDKKFAKGGPLAVKFPAENRFSLEASSPPPALIAQLEVARDRGAVKAQPSLANHSYALRQKFREIDPRFEVVPTFDGERDRYLIRAVQQGVDTRFKLDTKDKNAPGTIRNAIEWGIKGSLENCSIRFQDFPIFDHFKLDSRDGTFQIDPEPVWTGIAFMKCDAAATPVRRVRFDAAIRRGSRGVTIELASYRQAVHLLLKIGIDGMHGITMSIGFSELNAKDDSELHRLRGLSALLDALFGRNVISMELLDHPEITEPLPFVFSAPERSGGDLLAYERDWVKAFESLGELQALLKFPLKAGQLDSITVNESFSWIDGARLLKGDSVTYRKCRLSTTAETWSESLKHLEASESILIRCPWEVRIQSHSVGNFYVLVTCKGYRATISKRDDGSALLELEPQSDESACVIVRGEESQIPGEVEKEPATP